MPVRDVDTSNPTSSPLTGEPIVVEVTPPGGEARVLPWLGSRIQIARPINALPTASIGYLPHSGRLVNVGTQSSPAYRSIQEEVPAFSRVRVRSALPNPGDNVLLFDGYATRYRDTAGESGRGAAIECVHVLDDLERNIDQCVIGQAWRNALHFNDAGDVTFHPYIATARPTIFNPEGAANCDARLVSIPLEVQEQFGVDELLVPLFTAPGDPSAQPWTWARVLMYLLWWSVHTRYARLGTGPYVEQHDPPQFIDANLAQVLMADNAQLLRLDPRTNTGSDGQPWRRALLAVPRSHAVHGMTWLKALKWTCAKSGARFAIDDVARSAGSGNDTYTTYQSRIRFSVPGGHADQTVESEGLRGSALREAKLSSPQYDVAGHAATEILKHNDVHAYDVTEDHSQRVTSIGVLGAPYVYEVTVQLVPAWAAHAAWDVNPTNQSAVDAAINNMSGATGDQFVLSKNAGLSAAPTLWSVGRRWAVNTSGALTGLGRGFAPWNTAAYVLHDWRSEKLGELLIDDQYGYGNPISPTTADPATGQSAYATQQHLAVRRRILPLLSSMAFGAPRQPVVEISYDSGATWRVLQASVALSQRNVAIELTVDDLRTIVDPSNSAESYVTRYIRGQVRLRLTCCIEGDQALYIPPLVSAPSGATRAMEMLVTRPADVALHVRGTEHGGAAGGVNHWSGGNGGLNDNAQWPWTGRNAIVNEERTARDLTLRLDVSRYKATLDMVGLRVGREQEPGRFSDWMVGDECRGIIADDLAKYSHEFRAARWGNDLGEYPAVTSIEWTIEGGDGLSRAPQLATRVQLESPEARTEFDVSSLRVWANKGRLVQRENVVTQ